MKTLKENLIALIITGIILWGAAVAWDKWGYREEQDSSPETAAHYSK